MNHEFGKRLYLFLFLSLTLLPTVLASASSTPYADSVAMCYVVRGNDSLWLDFYTPMQPRADGACVVYLYGGGFCFGDRNDKQTRKDVAVLLSQGYRVAAIDYREHLSSVDLNNSSKSALLDHFDSAVNYGAADCAAAVAAICRDSATLGVNTSRIVLMGSSAGAISVLQLDFARCNDLPAADSLPTGWRPAAVVSFAGAVYARHRSLSYRGVPAPTAFFFGTVDRVVPIVSLNIFDTHYKGGKALTSLFDDEGFSYCTFRVKDHGHEVCNALSLFVDEVNLFLNHSFAGHPMRYDATCVRDDYPVTSASKLTLFGILSSEKGFEGLFE